MSRKCAVRFPPQAASRLFPLIRTCRGIVFSSTAFGWLSVSAGISLSSYELFGNRLPVPFRKITLSDIRPVTAHRVPFVLNAREYGVAIAELAGAYWITSGGGPAVLLSRDP